MPTNYLPGVSEHFTSAELQYYIGARYTHKIPDWMTPQMYHSWKPLFVRAWDKLKLPRTAGNKLTMTVALLLQKRQFIAAAIVVTLCKTARFKSQKRAEAREALDKYFAGNTPFPFTPNELKELATPAEAYKALQLLDYREKNS